MKPRIIHITDVHCNTENLRKLRMAVSGSYDIAFGTGDFECIDTVEELLKFEEKVVAVTGNMDHAGVRRVLSDAGALLDGRIEMVEGFTIAGIGGMDPRTSIRMLKSYDTGSIDILLSHHPPHGVLDLTRAGVRAGLWEVRDVVLALKPRLHLFGHIHESPGIVGEGGTLYVNPGPLMAGRYASVTLKGSRPSASIEKIV